MGRTKQKKAASKANVFSNGEYGSESIKKAKANKKKKMKSNAKHAKPSCKMHKSNRPRFVGTANIQASGKKKGKSKSKKGKGKQPKFKLNLHNREAGNPMHQVPWGGFDARLSKQQAAEWDETEVTTTQFVPWASISPEAWHRLDCEIISFARYARLRHSEVQAREFVVSEIAAICDELFRGDDVVVKPFGSYATPAVCSFTSDVDLVLWGAVPTPTHTIFAEHDDDLPKEVDCIEPPNRKRVKRSASTNDKLQRWREALEEDHDKRIQEEEAAERCKSPSEKAGSWKEQDIEESTDVNVEDGDAEEVVSKSVRGKKEVDADTHPVYVIDRAGAIELGADPNEIGESDTKECNLVQGESIEESTEDTQAAKEDPRSFFIIDRDGADNGRREKLKDMAEIHDSKRSPAMADGNKVKEDTDNADGDDSNSTENSEPNPVTVNGTADESTVNVDDAPEIRPISESDDDNADKLEGFAGAEPALGETLSQSTCESEEDKDSDGESDDMEVLFTARERGRAEVPPMDDDTRIAVVGALKRVARKVSRSGWVENIHVRQWAKVPIINITTAGGFECDAAIGGHNGMDTSHYASSLAETYRSFADVALFLKVLTAQQDLDKPFTGGLGSWKLYVMLSHHLERHLAAGGNDRPSEVLLSFFYRYAASKGSKCHLQSKVNNETRLTCNAGGAAEFGAVFRLKGCRELWAEGFSRLLNMMYAKIRHSCLSCLLHVDLLRSERDMSLNNAKVFRQKTMNSRFRRNCQSKIPHLQHRNERVRMRQEHTQRSSISRKGQKASEILVDSPLRAVSGTAKKRMSPFSAKKHRGPISRKKKQAMNLVSDGSHRAGDCGPTGKQKTVTPQLQEARDTKLALDGSLRAARNPGNKHDKLAFMRK